jgi:guanosine-3',5'-bis(diphosphate) 3'-pyrophosphohydrolase
MRLTEALDYAARAHVHQRRKGALAEPYVNHLTDVCDRLSRATQGRDVVLVMAGLLHDVAEDCGVSFDDLAMRFGPEVAGLVREVTDDMTLDKPERKRRQLRLTAGLSPRAKMLRLADKTSNLHSLLTSPPPHWSLERRQAYFEWARDVANNCRGINSRLDLEFDDAYRQKDKLEAMAPTGQAASGTPPVLKLVASRP